MGLNAYSTCTPLNTGCFLYTDSGLTTPVSNGVYSDGTNTYTVTGGLGEITSVGTCPATTTTTTSTTTTTTTEPTTTTTTTSTTTTTTTEPTTTTTSTTTTTTTEEPYNYINATWYLDCIQNSSPGAYQLRIPTSFSGSWYSGDDGNTYFFDSNQTPPTSYTITATAQFNSCPG